jgi:hypothetical protein
MCQQQTLRLGPIIGHTHTHTHTHTNTHTHTQIHTHTHTHTPACVRTHTHTHTYTLGKKSKQSVITVGFAVIMSNAIWNRETMASVTVNRDFGDYSNQTYASYAHSLTVPEFCAIARQSTRTIAILYDSVL